jgi:maltose-binding protein MalE
MNNKNLAAFSAAGKNAWPMPAYPFMDSVWSKVGAAEKALLEGTATGGTAGYFDKAMAALQTTVNSL